ncbi:MAG: SusC/RagA family TonB-linked outer membrane protein, partial [Bacteroidales bacterium]|nr:SusC/RagA family TonB-linked outer membrane protein [Bacteroidales bacterium]
FIEEGKPMGMVTAYAYDGWYTVDDFDYDPATGVYTLKEGIPDWAEDSYWTSFNVPAGQKAFPGALKIKDLHGAADGGPDGKITNLDSYTFGCMVPPASGSFALSGRWKNLDFNAAFNYVLGGYIMNVPALTNLYGSKDNRFGANRLAFVKDAYSPYRWNNGELEFVSDPTELAKMNANAKYWTPTSMVGMLVDKYLEPASFLRLKNLTIGYTVPSNISQKIGMKSLRAYVTATNLFTLTKYTGLNPEVNISSSTTPGVDNGNYPMARTYTFGLNITF